MLKKIINLILVAAMLLNLFFLFQPYWTYGDGETASVAGYVLLPKEHKALTAQLKDITNQKKLLTNVAFPLFLLLLLNVLGAVSGLLLIKTRTAGIFALINGVAGIVVFMTDVIVKGQPLWTALMVVFAVTAVLGLAQNLAFDYYPEDEDD